MGAHEPVTCTNCGKLAEAGDQWCSACGRDLESPPAPVATGTPPRPDSTSAASSTGRARAPVTAEPGPRAIRVFVSSTFRDFAAERDRLARFTFPRLRRICEERAVVFTDVDLRWGITDEQVAEGEVLPICLAEIDASRPFFIGMLGQRYGSEPGRISEELVERYPWLAKHLTKSVTELEIVHGVLNAPEMAGRAFFYFRDESASLALGPDAAPESAQVAERLADLKARIEASGLPLRKGFATPEELEAAVLSDLTAAIDELFPADEVPDPVERERMVHDAFGRELAAGFVERPDLVAALDSHAAGEGPPLLVTGESGSGKSALLAYWSLQRAGACPDTPVITHFCGASAAASDWVSLCHRVAAELERATGVSADLPAGAADVAAAFRAYLTRSAAVMPHVLVIDGLDQLEEREGALEMAFLPAHPPAGCTIVVSAAERSRPADEARRRGWATVSVGPLHPAVRQDVLLALLTRHSKALDRDRLERVCASPAAASPLFLAVLADELSVVASHDTLDGTIDRYLAVGSVRDVYGRVLERWERDYDARPGLVRDAMCALWAARRGLAESELAEILGGDAPLPQALLAPLVLAAGRQLASRSGMLTFTHALLREAVEERYLPDGGSRAAAHLRLAEHFGHDRMSARAVDELPWQLLRGVRWDRLAGLLVDLPFLDAAWNLNPHDVRRYWAAIEAASQIRMTEAYRDAFESPRGGAGEFALAILLGQSGHYRETSVLMQRWIDGCRETSNLVGLSAALGNQANALRARGDLSGAMTCLEEQERICRDTGDAQQLQSCLGNQALVLRTRGRLREAVVLLEEQEHICRRISDRASLQRSLGNRALVLIDLKDITGALDVLGEQERICRDLGDLDGLAMSLGHQGLAHRTLGNLDRAMSLHVEEERIRRELGDREGLQASLGEQALIHRKRGDLDRAEQLLEQQEHLCRELGLAQGLTAALGYRALVCMERGDLDGATALLEETGHVCRETGDLRGLGAALIHRSRVALQQHDDVGAVRLLEEAERAYRQTDDGVGLAECLARRAEVLRHSGELEAALPLYREEGQFHREAGDLPGLIDSLCNQGVVLSARGDLAEALSLSAEEERLCRETDDRTKLQRCLGNQGGLHLKLRNLDLAMSCFREQEAICRERGNPEGLAICLGNQALVFGARNDVQGALRLADEAYAIAVQHGLTSVAAWLESSIKRARGGGGTGGTRR